MQEFRWCDFTFDKRMFPDPKGFIQRLKARGLQICVWINPYIGQHSALFDEGMENGYLLKRKNGDIFQTDMWQPGMAIVDFTNPAACRWYADKLRALCDMGVDAFKTDFGERIPTDVQLVRRLRSAQDAQLLHADLQRRGLRRCSRNTTARARPACSPAPPRPAASSTPCTGAATASPSTNPWRKPCAAASRCA